MNLIDKISSYVLVTHAKQNNYGKISLLAGYLSAILICSGSIFLSFKLIFG
jgi:hypothetical protein